VLEDDDESLPVAEYVKSLLGFDPDDFLDDDVVSNIFCPTGPGGGVDPTCSPHAVGDKVMIGGKEHKVQSVVSKNRRMVKDIETGLSRVVKISEIDGAHAKLEDRPPKSKTPKPLKADSPRAGEAVPEVTSGVRENVLGAKTRTQALKALEVPEAERSAAIRGGRSNIPEGKMGDQYKNRLEESERFLTSSIKNTGELSTDVLYDSLDNGGRAFHKPSAGAYKSILNLAADTNSATVIHEWGHALEHQNPGIGRAAQAFLDKRVGGETSVKFNDVVGGGYSDDERGRSDGFAAAFGRHAHYVGKDYGGKATEIMSMGMELLYKDPIHFAKADPEYFEFVVGVLHGRIRG
jgi:hypothetical protein